MVPPKRAPDANEPAPSALRTGPESSARGCRGDERVLGPACALPLLLFRRVAGRAHVRPRQHRSGGEPGHRFRTRRRALRGSRLRGRGSSSGLGGAMGHPGARRLPVVRFGGAISIGDALNRERRNDGARSTRLLETAGRSGVVTVIVVRPSRDGDHDRHDFRPPLVERLFRALSLGAEARPGSGGLLRWPLALSLADLAWAIRVSFPSGFGSTFPNLLRLAMVGIPLWIVASLCSPTTWRMFLL